jgi:phytoene synthase
MSGVVVPMNWSMAQARLTTAETLDLWEKQLETVSSGVALEDADVALVDTLEKFPMDIQPFRDMIAGQQNRNLYRSRYQTFDELKLYCYRVAGTVGLMSSAVLGLEDGDRSAPWRRNQSVYIPQEEAINLGIANQLTNILRDVGEDVHRGRIYLPLEDLERFNYSEDDLLKGVNDDRWQALMRFQIERARYLLRFRRKGD